MTMKVVIAPSRRPKHTKAGGHKRDKLTAELAPQLAAVQLDHQSAQDQDQHCGTCEPCGGEQGQNPGASTETSKSFRSKSRKQCGYEQIDITPYAEDNNKNRKHSKRDSVDELCNDLKKLGKDVRHCSRHPDGQDIALASGAAEWKLLVEAAEARVEMGTSHSEDFAEAVEAMKTVAGVALEFLTGL